MDRTAMTRVTPQRRLTLRRLLQCGLLVGSFAMADSVWSDVDVNRASAADLDGLSGIGPASSTLMLNEREQHGAYLDWHDLMVRVKGIGRARAARLSAAGLTVNGTGFTSAAPVAAENGRMTGHAELPDPGLNQGDDRSAR